MSLGFHNSTPNARIRIITGHQFGISDLNMMAKLFARNGNRLNFNPELIRDIKLEQIRRLVMDGNLMFKIAIPNSEEVDGSFAEKLGIFRDANGDVVAFSGTSSVMFTKQSIDFESIDVFTSWNDKSRVETKIDDFEKLWTNETNSVKVFLSGLGKIHSETVLGRYFSTQRNSSRILIPHKQNQVLKLSNTLTEYHY